VSFPIPMQVHLIWHPAGDALCRPMAEQIRLALTRDAYQPLVPGIGIPVFYRCAGATPREPDGVPRPISIPDTVNDLRVALVTPELWVAPSWRAYLEQNLSEVKPKGRHGAMVRVALSPSVARGADLSETLDPADPRTPERLLQIVLLQSCRLLGGRPREGTGNRGAAPMKLFLSHTKRDTTGLTVAKALKGFSTICTLIASSTRSRSSPAICSQTSFGQKSRIPPSWRSARTGMSAARGAGRS
jgi:hypothetical protein